MKRELVKNYRTGVCNFASLTCPSSAQSWQKSIHLSSPYKIDFKKISSPSENKKNTTAQSDTTMAEKCSIDNDFQTQWTKGLLITAAWFNGCGSGNINSRSFNNYLCLFDSKVLRSPNYTKL